MDADDERVRQFVELRGRQEGAFSRAQAVASGIDDGALARRCRNRQIQRVHQGVYADFTGQLPWPTRAWAAWLACGPEAALTADTALRWHGLTGDWEDTSTTSRYHSAGGWSVDPASALPATKISVRGCSKDVSRVWFDSRSPY